MMEGKRPDASFLQQLRSELTERSFAHLYKTGGMRRVHLRGRDNILKRLLVHGAAFNLSLILRKTLGVGKPRQLQGLCSQLFAFVRRLFSGNEAVRDGKGGAWSTLCRKASQFVTVLRPTHLCTAA